MSDNPKRTPLMDSILGAMNSTVDGTAAVASTPKRPRRPKDPDRLKVVSEDPDADADTVYLFADGGEVAAAKAAGLRADSFNCRDSAIANRDVFLVVDEHNPYSVDLADREAERIYRAGAVTVSIVRPVMGNARNFVDWFADEWTADDVRASAANPSLCREWHPAKPGPVGTLPVIEITTDVEKVNNAVLTALERDPDIYRLGFALVTILDSGEAPRGVEYDGVAPPQVRPIPPAILFERIATRTRLVKAKRRGELEELAPTLPPAWCVSAIHARGEYPGFRPLDGVILAPTIRRDGSILDQPGYDPPTRLFYRPTIAFDPIPANPTRAEAEAARDLLLDLVCDFPFRSPADRALWLAGLLTVLAKSSFAGPAPLIGFDGNCPGAGKTMLADAIAAVAMGFKAPKMAFPAGRDGDTEMEKRITSLAMAGDRMTLLDNVADPIGGTSLDAALTTTSWKGRALGKSEIVTLPLNVAWFASGNNLSVRGDTLRRVLFARIEATEENPEEREGFKNPDLIGHILENRGRLVAAALTILRAYHVAGRPTAVKPLGSFEGWSRAVADPVAWITGVDPMSVRVYTKADDQDSAARAALVTGWAELPNSERGLIVAEACKILQAPGHDDKFVTLRSALADLFGDGEPIKSKSLGRHLLNLKGRVVGGMRLIGEMDTSRKVMRWRIDRTPGFAGFDSPDPGLIPEQTRQHNPASGNEMRPDPGFAGFEMPVSRVEEPQPGEFTGEGPEKNPANPANPVMDPRKAVLREGDRPF